MWICQSVCLYTNSLLNEKSFWYLGMVGMELLYLLVWRFLMYRVETLWKDFLKIDLDFLKLKFTIKMYAIKMSSICLNDSAYKCRVISVIIVKILWFWTWVFFYASYKIYWYFVIYVCRYIFFCPRPLFHENIHTVMKFKKKNVVRQYFLY